MVTCRDEILQAFEALHREHGSVDFAPGEILSHLRSTGSSYADSTVRTHVASHMLADGTLIRAAPGLYRLARHRSAPAGALRPVPLRAGDLNQQERITEDAVKAAVEAKLVAEGWEVEVRWGRERGIAVTACSGDQRLVLEAKGEAPPGPQQVNYFLGAVGELVQRLDNPAITYGLALPDNRQYRGLVGRPPTATRRRVVQVVYFVDSDGTVDVDKADRATRPAPPLFAARKREVFSEGR